MKTLVAVSLVFLFQVLDTGQRAFRERDWVVAEREFRKWIDSHPRDAQGYRWLGMTYAAQEKYGLALPYFQKACGLAPADTAVCYYYARSLFLTNRFEEALQAYRSLRHPDGRALLGTSMTLEALGRLKEADELYRRAVETGIPEAGVEYQKFQKRRSAPSLATPEIRFEPAALPITVRDGAKGEKRLPETMIAGVAVFDYNNDGRPDIYLARGGLLRNEGAGRFTDVTAEAGLSGIFADMGVAAADFDNDGDTDLFVTGLRCQRLYRNTGRGTFEDVTAAAGLEDRSHWTVAAAWVDVDADGKLDLFIARYVEYDEATEPYCGTAKIRQYCDPRLYKPLPNALYRNVGGGRFADISRESGIAAHLGKGMGVAIGDADSDGRIDIFVANDTEPNFLFRNKGGAKFEEKGLQMGVAFNENGKAISSMGAEMRDWNNDGREDLFLTALTNETYPLFRNDGQGFTDVTVATGIARATLPYTGWSCAMIDLDNDGWKDLVTANGHVLDNAELLGSRRSAQANLVFLNRRTAFAAAFLPGEARHRGLAYGDLDGDGRLDLVVTGMNKPAEILWNHNPGGNWISFDLEGRHSNRNGIGAMIQIQTAQGKQWARRVTGNGYAGSSAGPVHFGLGEAGGVDAVDITWPGGTVQKIGPLSGNRVHRITER